MPRQYLIFIILLALPIAHLAGALDEPQNATRQAALASITNANYTLLFVDKGIANAEFRRENVVDAVSRLAEARRLYARSTALFGEGDYAGANRNASEATNLAHQAFSSIPITRTESLNRVEALSLLESVNDDITFVDIKIAVAEAEHTKVTSAVPRLAEARRLARQASAALDGGDFQKSAKLSANAKALVQDALWSIGTESVPFSRIVAAFSSLFSLILFVFLYSKGKISVTVRHYGSSRGASSGLLGLPDTKKIGVDLEYSSQSGQPGDDSPQSSILPGSDKKI